jgi:hypothetical protein
MGRIYKEIGFGGLWNGLPVRIVMIGTLTGLQWMIYVSFVKRERSKISLPCVRTPSRSSWDSRPLEEHLHQRQSNRRFVFELSVHEEEVSKLSGGFLYAKGFSTDIVF